MANTAPAEIQLADTDGVVAAIGARMRDLRVKKGLTLQALADQTGLSPSMLSLVERGRTSPSIGSLIAICSALGVQMGDVLTISARPRRDPVSRAADQPEFRTGDGVLRRVLADDRMRGVEVALETFGPEGSVTTGLQPESGHEYGIVLDGELTVEFEDERYTLGPGDVISYTPAEAQRIVNLGKGKARALRVNLQRG